MRIRPGRRGMPAAAPARWLRIAPPRDGEAGRGTTLRAAPRAMRERQMLHAAQPIRGCSAPAMRRRRAAAVDDATATMAPASRHRRGPFAPIAPTNGRAARRRRAHGKKLRVTAGGRSRRADGVRRHRVALPAAFAFPVRTGAPADRHAPTGASIADAARRGARPLPQRQHRHQHLHRRRTRCGPASLLSRRHLNPATVGLRSPTPDRRRDDAADTARRTRIRCRTTQGFPAGPRARRIASRRRRWHVACVRHGRRQVADSSSTGAGHEQPTQP